MSGQEQRGSIKFNDMQITFEGPRDFVEAMVAKFANADEWTHSSVQGTHPAAASSVETNVAEAIAKKKPRGHHEIIAVLAFALAEGGTPIFGDEEIRAAYIKAGVRPPKIVSQALRDAKNKYQFVELAGKRGRYRLTNHGDRVVRFDLPRAGGGK